MWSWNLFDLEGIPKFGPSVMISTSFHIVNISSYLPAQSPFAQATRYCHIRCPTCTCPNTAFLSASVSSPTYSAKSSLLSQFTLTSSTFSEHRISRKMFKMLSSLIPPSFHQFVVYVFNQCKLKCREPKKCGM